MEIDREGGSPSLQDRVTELRLTLEAATSVAVKREREIDRLRRGLEAWETDSGRWRRRPLDWPTYPQAPDVDCPAPEREVPC